MSKCDHVPEVSCGECDGWSEVERLRAALREILKYEHVHDTDPTDAYLTVYAVMDIARAAIESD